MNIRRHLVLLAIILLTGTDAAFAQTDEEQQRKYDYYFLEAFRQKALGKYDASFALLQHCLEINPEAGSAYYELAQYYMFLKQEDRAVQALEKAVANDPDNFWYAQGLANLYQKQDETEKAIALLEAMSTRFPTKQDPLYNLLDLYNRAEEYDKMLAILNRLEERTGKNEQLTMEKFRIYLQKKDHKRAFREIESLVEEYPMDTRYQVVLADAYLQNGKKKEAYNLYRKVLEQEPDNPMALYSLAGYYRETGQEDLYQQQIDTLLLNRKVPSETKLLVMRQLIVENERADADSTRIIGLFDRILEEDPEDAQLPLLYVQYLLSKGMDQHTVPVLNHVLDIDPTPHRCPHDPAGRSHQEGRLQGSDPAVRRGRGGQSGPAGVLLLPGHRLQPGRTHGRRHRHLPEGPEASPRGDQKRGRLRLLHHHGRRLL